MPDGWSKWERHVIEELRRLSKGHDDIKNEIRQIAIDIASLKTRAAVWGAVAGSIPMIIFTLIDLFFRK